MLRLTKRELRAFLYEGQVINNFFNEPSNEGWIFGGMDGGLQSGCISPKGIQGFINLKI
jgi:hypothetical protein